MVEYSKFIEERMNIVYGAFADEYAVSLEEQIEGLIQNKIDYLEISLLMEKHCRYRPKL